MISSATGTAVTAAPRDGRDGRAVTGAALVDLHAAFAATRDPAVQARLVASYTGLVHALARRFAHRGVAADDLVQVAYVGLVKAIHRFEPGAGLQFSTFAVPTILGELKRHLRDHTWAVRPPRRLHDLHLAVERAVDDLTNELRRSPSVEEVARRVGLPDDEVVEAIEAGSARWFGSIDAPLPDGQLAADRLAGTDAAAEAVDTRLAVAGLLARLAKLDALAVRLRFLDGLTQAEIARTIGVSQMQVSRILSRSLSRLRVLAQRANEA